MKVSHLGVVTLPEPLPYHRSLLALQQDATNVYWTPDYENECEALLKCSGLPLWTSIFKGGDLGPVFVDERWFL